MVRITAALLVATLLPVVGSSQQTDSRGADSFADGWLIENEVDAVFFSQSGKITAADLTLTEGLYVPSLPGVDGSTKYRYSFKTESGRELTVILQDVGNSDAAGEVFVGVDGNSEKVGTYPKDTNLHLSINLRPNFWEVFLNDDSLFLGGIDDTPFVFDFSRTLGDADKHPDDAVAEVRVGLSKIDSDGEILLEGGNLNALESIPEGVGSLEVSAGGNLEIRNGIIGVVGGGNGNITIDVEGDFYLVGGTGDEIGSFSMIGHGGPSAPPGSGEISVTTGGDFSVVSAGSVLPTRPYSQVGHGGSSVGDPSGDILVVPVGPRGDIVLSTSGSARPIPGGGVQVIQTPSVSPQVGSSNTIRIIRHPSIDILGGQKRSEMKGNGISLKQKIKLEGLEGRSIRSHSRIMNVGVGSGDFAVRASYSDRHLKTTFKGSVSGERQNLTAQIRSGRLTFASLPAGQSKLVTMISRKRGGTDSQSNRGKSQIKISGATTAPTNNRDRITMILK